MDSLEDNFLMHKVREGDLDKLGLLFERYKKPLYGYFYALNRDRDLSEDLVQNVFFRILKYRQAFRGDGQFTTWLFSIARNVNIDHHKKKKVVAKESPEHWQDKVGHNENRLMEYQHNETEQILSMAMDKLPSDKREILVLSKYQNKKYKEIAQLLGCAEGTVKAKVFRALHELKLIYNQLEKQL